MKPSFHGIPCQTLSIAITVKEVVTALAKKIPTAIAVKRISKKGINTKGD